MAAPSSAYQTEKANFDTTTTERDVYWAKLLQNTTPPIGENWGDGYFNSTDNDATKKSKILSIFRLDGILRGKTTLIEGFIGYVRTAPTVSDNAKHHANNRLSGVNITDEATGQTYQLLNDAGLNTSGHAALTDNLVKYANLILQDVFFRSAFYLDSSKFGLKYKINNGSWITADTKDLNGAVQDTLAKKLVYSEPLLLTPSVTSANQGDTIYIKPYIENNELNYEGDTISMVLDDQIAQVQTYKQSTACNPSGQQAVNFWMLKAHYNNLNSVTESDAYTGIMGHTTIYRDTVISAGYYVFKETPNLDGWAANVANKAFYFNSEGYIRFYVYCPPFEGIVVGTVQWKPRGEFDPYVFDKISFVLLDASTMSTAVAPSDVAITGFISTNPDTMVNGWNYNTTLLTGNSSANNTTNSGFEFSDINDWYLKVNASAAFTVTTQGSGKFYPF